MENQLASVNRILEELELNEIPQLLVFNKADLVADKEQLANMCNTYHALAVAAVDRKSLVALVDEISNTLAKTSNAQ